MISIKHKQVVDHLNREYETIDDDKLIFKMKRVDEKDGSDELLSLLIDKMFTSCLRTNI